MSIFKKHSVFATFTMVSEKGLFILLQFVALFIFADVHAQHDGAGEYNFNLMKVRDGHGDTVINLSMDNIAANGYGQWTVSSSTGSPANKTQSGWFLLGNSLQENEIISASIPPGVVQSGSFSGPFPISHSKVTCNLSGRVRYVGMDFTNTTTADLGFQIQGLNTKSGGSGEIDIKMAGMPNPPSTRYIVKSAILPYTNASTTKSGTTHTIIPLGTGAGQEPDFRDTYDIACDAKYLYIVWCTNNANVLSPSTSEIWATAINLTTNVVVTGFPTKVSQGTGLVADNGIRPTVACDVRNSPSSPQFTVAYISSGAVTVREFSGTSVITGPPIHSETLQNHFHDPFGGADKTTNEIATHARVVVSSVAGSSTPVHSVYILDKPIPLTSLDHDLIFYNALTWTGDIASYVDGAFDNGGGTVLFPLPVPSSVHSANGVADKHIIAFANPYDNQDVATNGYRQFHCLYQLSVNGSTPLFLVRNANINYTTPSNDTRVILSQSGGVLTTDPSTYVAAVNQMGIHVHWRAMNSGTMTHFYSRDRNRTFDENIEENTLVTDTCRVMDGRSAHGGTQGATVLPTAIVTIWTNPNWFAPEFPLQDIYASIKDSGSFVSTSVSSLFVSKLAFVGSGVTLQVGDNIGSIPGRATFVMTPYSYCNFGSSDQGLTINPNCVFEYYAYGTPNGSTQMGVSSSPFGGLRNIFYFYPLLSASSFQASSYGDPGLGAITLQGKTNGPSIVRATLNLHGGSHFYINGYSTFVSDMGDIESLFESEVTPTWYNGTTDNGTTWSAVTPQGGDYFPAPPPSSGSSDYMNAPGPGRMYLSYGTSITNTVINSGDENVNTFPPDYDDIITITGNSNNTSPVTISHSTFTNIGGTWLGSSTFNSNTVVKGTSRLILLRDGIDELAAVPEVDISDCHFDSWQVAAYNPENILSIDGSDFSNIRNAAINLQRDRFLSPSPVTYDKISIASCDFRTFRAALGSIDPFSTDNIGIYISGFDNSLMVGTESDPDYHPRILLEGNTFTTTTGTGVDYAIYLDNSNVSALSNQVNKSSYQTGIYNLSSDLVPTTTFSFFCSNTLANLAQYGLHTATWQGYSKLNDISACTTAGHYSQGDKNGDGVDFCNYHGNTGPGLLLSSTSTIDMSGINTVGINFPGDNTISLNNTGSSSSTGQIQVATGSHLIIGTSSSSYSTYGHNNIICNSTTDKLIYAPSGGTFALGGIEDNYWGYGSTPTAIHLFGTSDVTHMPNISYTPAGTDPNYNTTKFTFSGVSCGFGFNEGVKAPGNPPLSVESGNSLDSSDCDKLQWEIHSIAQGGGYQKMYDSARYAIEQCATQNLFLSIWTDFDVATSGAQYMSNDKNRWPVYREWLKKVLYLNLDTNYYCEDVLAILSTFQYFNAQRGSDLNGALAVTKFLIDSNRCLSYLGDVNAKWKSTRLEQHKTWQDTAHNPSIPLDTTLPSIDDLDLGILRGPEHAAVKDAFTPSSAKKIEYLIASENPFREETKLRFGLADAEYMMVEIFDLLGNKLYSDSKLFGEGDEEWRIEGKSLARGALYARLSTMGGEVKTVKLIHEK